MKYISLNELKTIRTLVDDDVYAKYSSFSMSFKNGYVLVRVDGRNEFLHRLILDNGSGLIIDHINHDPLDNRRENLRLCSIKQNIRNSRKWKTKDQSSKYKGVGYRSSRKKWRAYICVDGKQISLGSYDSEIEAAKAYDFAAIKYFKEYANLNFN